MKYDKQRITIIISDIERFLFDLESFNVKTPEDLQDKKNFYSVSMAIFAGINRTIDLGDEIISAKNFDTPGTYKDIFYVLWSNKIIDKDLKKKLDFLIENRNALSHEYSNFTHENLYSLVQETNSIKRFVKIVKNLVPKI